MNESRGGKNNQENRALGKEGESIQRSDHIQGGCSAVRTHAVHYARESGETQAHLLPTSVLNAKRHFPPRFPACPSACVIRNYKGGEFRLFRINEQSVGHEQEVVLQRLRAFHRLAGSAPFTSKPYPRGTDISCGTGLLETRIGLPDSPATLTAERFVELFSLHVRARARFCLFVSFRCLGLFYCALLKKTKQKKKKARHGDLSRIAILRAPL